MALVAETDDAGNATGRSLILEKAGSVYYLTFYDAATNTFYTGTDSGGSALALDASPELDELMASLGTAGTLDNVRAATGASQPQPGLPPAPQPQLANVLLPDGQPAPQPRPAPLTRLPGAPPAPPAAGGLTMPAPVPGTVDGVAERWVYKFNILFGIPVRDRLIPIDEGLNTPDQPPAGTDPGLLPTPRPRPIGYTVVYGYAWAFVPTLGGPVIPSGVAPPEPNTVVPGKRSPFDPRNIVADPNAPGGTTIPIRGARDLRDDWYYDRDIQQWRRRQQ